MVSAPAPQIGADGRRSQIFLALSTAADFRSHLSTFSDFYSSLGAWKAKFNFRNFWGEKFSFLGPPNPENVPEDGKLKSECIVKDNRRYYLDLKENARGRFLRVRKEKFWLKAKGRTLWIFGNF